MSMWYLNLLVSAALYLVNILLVVTLLYSFQWHSWKLLSCRSMFAWVGTCPVLSVYTIW